MALVLQRPSRLPVGRPSTRLHVTANGFPRLLNARAPALDARRITIVRWTNSLGCMTCQPANLRRPADCQGFRVRHLSQTQFATRTVGVPASVQSLDESAHISTLPCMRKQSPVTSVVATRLLWCIHPSNLVADSLLPAFNDQDRWFSAFVGLIHDTRTHLVHRRIITGLNEQRFRCKGFGNGRGPGDCLRRSVVLAHRRCRSLSLAFQFCP